MSIRIDGYSERGMVNALCEDIVRANGMQQLSSFLSWCSFPIQKSAPNFSGIKDARILVEQGFSDFGDLDLLILLDHDDGRKQAVLIEAKVATDAAKRIGDQWSCFESFLKGDHRQTSSLFVQIYRKMRLIERVANLNQQFDPHPVWGRQSLGSNRIVLKAAELLSEYRSNPWYVILVPDNNNDVAHFFENTLGAYTHDPTWIPGWDVSCMGFLTWPDLHKKIQDDSAKHNWPRSLSSFDWNEFQIYQSRSANNQAIEKGSVALCNGQRVVVVGMGTRSPRVISAVTDGAYFPKSFCVPVGELQTLQEPRMEISCHQPKMDATYNWSPTATEKMQPSDRAPVPKPPQRIKVKQAGWDTIRVVALNENGEEQGDEFHVFPHHIERQLI